MSETITFAKMPVSETWRATDDLVWIEHGDGSKVLNRRWQRQETGDSEYRPVPAFKDARPEPPSIQTETKL